MTSTTTARAPRIAILPEPAGNPEKREQAEHPEQDGHPEQAGHAEQVGNPAPAGYLKQAVLDGGGSVDPLSSDTTGLVIGGKIEMDELSRLLTEHPGIGWIQLPSAGIERYADVMNEHADRTWTSAKGAYARPVAEHILALTLAALRRLPELARTKTWGPEVGAPLYGSRIVIIGAGGIALEAIRLLRVFDTYITVVRRRGEPVQAADRTVTTDQLQDVLPEADVVVLAAALTDGTTRLIGQKELSLLKPSSVLVNIARGKLVDTDALLDALKQERLAGAALDVTDPEPLPDGHPLWNEPRCLITPHTADTEEMVRPLISARVQENVRRWTAGQELEGLVDVAAGY